MSATALAFTGKQSIAEVLYPKDAIVMCRSCGKPLYRLTASIYVGENAGSRTSRAKFAPVSPADLQALIDRQDLEPGQRALVKAMPLADRALHCDRIQPIAAGQSDACPACQESFVFGRAADTSEGVSRFVNKEYVISLAIIPPQGHARRVR